MNKKGSTETMSFLIGVIIFIMIIVPIGFAVYHYMQSQTGMERTLKLLVERTSELEDGQAGNVVGYIEKNYIMLGFEKDKSYFGSGSGDYYWECQANVGLGSNTLSFVRDIKKPGKCGKRACLCACPVTGSLQIVGYFGAGSCQDSKTVCEVYDEDKNPKFYGGADCEYGPFITHSVPTMEISFERQGQTIGICEEPPCISNEVNSARDVFKRFHEAYKKCDDYEVNDCICDAVNGEALPSDHYIIFKNDGAKTEITLHDTDGPTRATAVIEETLIANYNAGKDEAKLITTADISRFGYEAPSGYNFAFLKEDSQLLYRTKEGYVGFVEEGEGIKAVKADKEYCRIKSGQAQTAPEETNQKCTADKMEGKCNTECGENTFALGRKGQYCPTLTCCITDPDVKCALQDGSCNPSCEPSSQTPIAGEGLCPTERPACCKEGSPCENLAGGECKGACDERLNEEEAQGSLFTSPACGGGYKCCVEKAVDTCLNYGGLCQQTLCDLNTQTPFESTSSQLRCPRDNRYCCWPQSLCEIYSGGVCKDACEDGQFEREAPRSYFESSPCKSSMHCCIKIASESCTSKGGTCQGDRCDLSKQTALTGLFCPEANPICCKSGSTCEKMAGGKCKNICNSIDEELASGSLFTSMPCENGELCCIKKVVPLVPETMLEKECMDTGGFCRASCNAGEVPTETTCPDYNPICCRTPR